MCDRSGDAPKMHADIDTSTEALDAEVFAFVGRLIEVQYPRHGTLKGLVTGYYKGSGMLRVDYLSNVVRISRDLGTVIGQGYFRSEYHSCTCAVKLGPRLSDSVAAAKYFNDTRMQYPRRTGRIGYMLGKVVKSDWGDDGVFLGMLVGYQKGQKFKITYADGDDEWGQFVERFRAFELEDGVRRKIAFMDLRAEELQAAGAGHSQKKKEATNTQSVLSDREIGEATAKMMDEIIGKLDLTEGEEKTRSPKKAPEEKSNCEGPFSRAFLKSSGMERVAAARSPTKEAQAATVALKTDQTKSEKEASNKQSELANSALPQSTGLPEGLKGSNEKDSENEETGAYKSRLRSKDQGATHDASSVKTVLLSDLGQETEYSFGLKEEEKKQSLFDFSGPFVDEKPEKTVPSTKRVARMRKSPVQRAKTIHSGAAFPRRSEECAAVSFYDEGRPPDLTFPTRPEAPQVDFTNLFGRSSSEPQPIQPTTQADCTDLFGKTSVVCKSTKSESQAAFTNLLGRNAALSEQTRTKSPVLSPLTSSTPVAAMDAPMLAASPADPQVDVASLFGLTAAVAGNLNPSSAPESIPFLSADMMRPEGEDFGTELPPHMQGSGERLGEAMVDDQAPVHRSVVVESSRTLECPLSPKRSDCRKGAFLSSMGSSPTVTDCLASPRRVHDHRATRVEDAILSSRAADYPASPPRGDPGAGTAAGGTQGTFQLDTFGSPRPVRHSAKKPRNEVARAHVSSTNGDNVEPWMSPRHDRDRKKPSQQNKGAPDRSRERSLDSRTGSRKLKGSSRQCLGLAPSALAPEGPVTEPVTADVSQYVEPDLIDLEATPVPVQIQSAATKTATVENVTPALTAAASRYIPQPMELASTEAAADQRESLGLLLDESVAAVVAEHPPLALPESLDAAVSKDAEPVLTEPGADRDAVSKLATEAADNTELPQDPRMPEDAGTEAAEEEKTSTPKGTNTASAVDTGETPPSDRAAQPPPLSPKPARHDPVAIGLELPTFINQLKEITKSKGRVTGATTTALSLARKGGAEKVIDATVRYLKEQVSDERRIALFYVMDSILYNARHERDKAKTGGVPEPEVISYFGFIQQRLKEIVDTMSEQFEAWKTLRRVIKLWKQNEIFSEAVLEEAAKRAKDNEVLHERVLKDLRLSNDGKTPLYLRNPKGPDCYRVVLGRVYAGVGNVPHFTRSEEDGEGHDRPSAEMNSDWAEVEEQAMGEPLSGSTPPPDLLLGTELCQVGDDEAGEIESGEAVADNGDLPEEGEIQEPPPLPSDTPPMDIDDPNFVPPLPSDDEDPNFVPPLPTSPPPRSRSRSPQRYRRDSSRDMYRRRDPSGGFPGDRPLSFRERAARSDRYHDFPHRHHGEHYYERQDYGERRQSYHGGNARHAYGHQPVMSMVHPPPYRGDIQYGSHGYPFPPNYHHRHPDHYPGPWNPPRHHW